MDLWKCLCTAEAVYLPLSAIMEKRKNLVNKRDMKKNDEMTKSAKKTTFDTQRRHEIGRNTERCAPTAVKHFSEANSYFNI